MRHLLILALLTSAAAFGQDNELVELSPFTVSSERDRSYVLPEVKRPEVAITITKPATAVVMEITLSNTAEKSDLRNREVYTTLKDLQAAVQRNAGLTFERREIQLRGEARRKYLVGRESVSSFASVALKAPLEGDADLFALVQRMRSVVASVTPSGSTKVVDGPVSLVLSNRISIARKS